jgi:hypothetical protein
VRGGIREFDGGIGGGVRSEMEIKIKLKKKACF